jgi:hypothetical protein
LDEQKRFRRRGDDYRNARRLLHKRVTTNVGGGWM